MENKIELIKELRSIDNRRREIEKEFSEWVNIKIAAERKYNNGEIVTVIDGKNVFDGVIMGAYILVRLEPFDIKNYFEDNKRLERDVNSIRYVVNRLKKDGSHSMRRVNSQRTLPDAPDGYGAYIQKKHT